MSDTITTEAIKVGDAVTLSPHSDCHPATVIRVVSPKTVHVQMDSWKITSGSEHDGSAEYEYSRDPQGSVVILRKTKKGWRGSGYRAYFGERRRYWDPCF
jgi:hypothetical protein